MPFSSAARGQARACARSPSGSGPRAARICCETDPQVLDAAWAGRSCGVKGPHEIGRTMRPLARACDVFVGLGLAALVVFTPLAFGSVETWAIVVVEAAVFCIGF